MSHVVGPKYVVQNPKMVKRAVFQAWVHEVDKTAYKHLQTDNEGLRAEVGRLGFKVGKKSTSIWEMNKEDLVATAMAELGMTLAAAMKETVNTLRERIRRQRDVNRVAVEPQCQLPTGLEKMPLNALKSEMELRNIAMPPKQTRAAFILAIRDDVAIKSLLLEDTQTSQSSKKSGGHVVVNQDGEDWDMVQKPETPRQRPRRKSEGR